MKRLYLTAVVTVPSEEGQKRIEEALDKQNFSMIQDVYRCEQGKSREDWQDILGGKVPKGFDEAEKEFYKNNSSSEIDEDGFIELAPEELEYEFLDYLVPLKNIIDVTDTQEIGSIIILKNRYGISNRIIMSAFKGSIGMFYPLPKSDEINYEDYLS